MAGKTGGKAPATPKPADPDDLHYFYREINLEVCRYRDREWANVTTFTAAIGAVLALQFHGNATPDHTVQPFILGAALTFLAIGSIFFTSCAHRGLARNRTIQARLERLLRWADCRDHKLTEERRANWYRGFWSHLVPFFFTDTALAMFGLWDLSQNAWLVVLVGVVLVGTAAFLCILFQRDHAATGQCP